MLLVDVSRGEMESIPRERVDTPFAPVAGLLTFEDACNFLRRFQGRDGRLRRTLAAESASLGRAFFIHRMSDVDLIAVAAREIAARWLQVGLFVPDRPTLLFDTAAPHSSYSDNVVFSNLTAASRFVASLRIDDRAITVLNQALTHDAAQEWLLNDRDSRAQSMIVGADRMMGRAARLLAAGALLLQPVNFLRSTFRLEWRRRPTRSVQKAEEAAPRAASGATRRSQTPPPRIASPLVSTRAESSFAAASPATSNSLGSIVEASPPKTQWVIEAKVVGTDSKSVSGITVALSREQGGECRLTSAPEGFVRFTGLDPGEYWLSLPGLDADTWEQIAADPLPPDLACCQGEASWSTTPGGPPESTMEYSVVEGDCFSSVAFRHGFLPETLVNLAQNAWINRPGRDPHILFPGNLKSQSEGPAEVVAVPPKRPKSVKATTGMRYVVRHKGVPEYLRVQFIDAEGEPRANVPYLLEIEDSEGGPSLTTQGQTDSTGLLEVPIPPTATRAFVTFGRGSTVRRIELDIGYLDPIESVAGVQERLENLGYSCGEDGGELGLATHWALQRFQAANGLSVTGKIDSATQAELIKLHHA
jgi:hypothetical protein